QRVAAEQDVDLFLPTQAADVLEIVAQRQGVVFDVCRKVAEQTAVEHRVEAYKLVLRIAADHRPQNAAQQLGNAAPAAERDQAHFDADSHGLSFSSVIVQAACSRAATAGHSGAARCSSTSSSRGDKRACS